jgi:ribosomal protein S3AE
MTSAAEDKALLGAIAEHRIARKLANSKAREELRNAARVALAEQGYTKDVLKAQIRAVVTDAVKDALSSSSMDAIIQAAVTKELMRQLNNNGTNLSSVILQSIQTAAQKEAGEFIKNNMSVIVKDHW